MSEDGATTIRAVDKRKCRISFPLFVCMLAPYLLRLLMTATAAGQKVTVQPLRLLKLVYTSLSPGNSSRTMIEIALPLDFCNFPPVAVECLVA